MIIYIYDNLLIFQYQVSTTVMDWVVVFALFVFMLALLCFCVATVELLLLRLLQNVKIYLRMRASSVGGTL